MFLSEKWTSSIRIETSFVVESSWLASFWCRRWWFCCCCFINKIIRFFRIIQTPFSFERFGNNFWWSIGKIAKLLRHFRALLLWWQFWHHFSRHVACLLRIQVADFFRDINYNINLKMNSVEFLQIICFQMSTSLKWHSSCPASDLHPFPHILMGIFSHWVSPMNWEVWLSLWLYLDVHEVSWTVLHFSGPLPSQIFCIGV